MLDTHKCKWTRSTVHDVVIGLNILTLVMQITPQQLKRSTSIAAKPEQRVQGMYNGGVCKKHDTLVPNGHIVVGAML